MTDRQHQAAKIIAAPANFKVCVPCGSIVTARSNICLACSGYRFDETEARVIEQAKALASREASSVAPGDLQ